MPGLNGTLTPPGHGEALRSEEPGGNNSSVRQGAFQPDIDQPYLATAEQVGSDQPGFFVASLDQQ
jgi:hypothetical protein